MDYRRTFATVIVLFAFAQGIVVAAQGDFEYEDDSDKEMDTREFMIPHPRLGRYMDYAVLKILANYLKDSYTLNDMLPPGAKMEAPPDVLLQRELRDMKGKGYGIPIPRVGKRSTEEISDIPPARPESTAEVRALLAALMQNQMDHKRTQQPSVRSMFKPRVGRAGAGRVRLSKFSRNWQPVPRVG